MPTHDPGDRFPACPRYFRIRPAEVVVRKVLATLLLALAFLLAPSSGFAWSREGHHVIVILAMQNMSPETTARVRELLGTESLECQHQVKREPISSV